MSLPTGVSTITGYPKMLLVLTLCALVFPWINPFALGPSSSAFSWLVSAFCATLSWAAWRLGAGQGVDTHQWTGRVAASWLAAAAISSAIALWQYFGVSSDFSPWMSAASAGEAFANLRQRNQFASLTAIGVAALLWWAPSLGRSVAGPAIILLAVANAASASRMGLAQLLMLTLFSAVWRGPDRRFRLGLCLGALLAYGVAATFLPVLLNSLLGIEADTVWGRIARNEGCSSRLVLWSNVVHLIGLKPWLGWGWGELDYAHYLTLYPGARFCDILDNAHNLPLHLAVELGVPLAVLACGGFVAWIFRARPWRETDPGRQLAWSVLAVILLHSMFEYPLWYGPFQMAFVLSLLLLRRQGQYPAVARLWLSRAQSVLVASSVAVLAYAAWEYHRVSQIYLPAEARASAYRDNPLERIRGARLFRDQALFAELTVTAMTKENAQWTHDTALAMLHFSPEPRVIEKVIESATMLGRQEEASAHLARYSAAFPQAYATWSRAHGLPGAPTSAAQPAM